MAVFLTISRKKERNQTCVVVTYCLTGELALVGLGHSEQEEREGEREREIKARQLP
jgi:hypothetical protein